MLINLLKTVLNAKNVYFFCDSSKACTASFRFDVSVRVTKKSSRWHRNIKLKKKRKHLVPKCLFQIIGDKNRHLVKNAYQKINFLISQQKHMLWVLKRNVSMRRFF